MARHLAANGITLLIVALVLVFGLVNWGQSLFERPGPLQQATVFEVPGGDTFRRAADRLEANGVISDASIFRIGMRYAGLNDVLKAGEYEIPAGATMRDVYDIITSGVGIQLRVTIPEGFTSFEVVERLRATEDLVGEIAEVPPEGTLAPNTYSFSRGATRESVLAQMISAQEEILANAWENRAEGLPIDSPEDLLILASIIEREAGGAEEWAKVASVFVNRLNQGMRLEADATVRYGITLGERKLRRGLLRSELDRVTPYNTYKIDGLPPTPIANPGRLAIEATAQPETTDFIFFVADGTGGHAFSVTYEEHNRNVREWRRIEAERRAAQQD
ncbi:MAG: endolytic transglycosylase MltG [Pseudomonadota bacterium]